MSSDAHPSSEDIRVEATNTCVASDDTAHDDTVAKYASMIRECMPKVGRHAFGESGEHILKFVCLDSSGNVRGFSTVCRDDPRGGRILVRKAGDLRGFLVATHDKMPVDIMGTVPATVHCAPLSPDCLLAFPPESMSQKLLAALGISETVELRLSDGKGLGKSSPRFSENKFKYLVPAAPENSRKAAKSSRPPPPPAPIKRKRDVYETLARRVSVAKGLDGEERRIALEMLGAFRENAEDYFEDLFGPLCDLSFDASAIALANKKFMKAMIGGIDADNPVIIDALSDYYERL